jgi:hypothetical protein
MLPATFNCRAGGCCMTAARIIAGSLIESGVNANDISIIEGWIQFIDEDGSTPSDLKFEHTWVVDEEIIDPTIEQFYEHLDCYQYERIVKEEISAVQYLNDNFINTQNPEIFFNDNIIPENVKKFLPTLQKEIK